MNAPICQGPPYFPEEGDGPLCLQHFASRPRVAWPRWAHYAELALKPSCRAALLCWHSWPICQAAGLWLEVEVDSKHYCVPRLISSLQCFTHTHIIIDLITLSRVICTWLQRWKQRREGNTKSSILGNSTTCSIYYHFSTCRRAKHLSSIFLSGPILTSSSVLSLTSSSSSALSHCFCTGSSKRILSSSTATIPKLDVFFFPLWFWVWVPMIYFKSSTRRYWFH